MEATINLNSISSPAGVNLSIGILFLLFYMINKETRADILKLLLGVLISISLSYAMTRQAFLLQTISIALFHQFLLMILYQELDILPDWKIPLIAVALISFSSIFIFNLHIYIIIYGVVASLILSFMFWARYNLFNKGDEEKKTFANLNFFIVVISAGFFFGLNNFILIIFLDILAFMITFAIIYFWDLDNTRLKPLLFFIIAIYLWFATIHVIPEWDVIRIFL